MEVDMKVSWDEVGERFEGWPDSIATRSVKTLCWMRPETLKLSDDEIMLQLMAEVWNASSPRARREFAGMVDEKRG